MNGRLPPIVDVIEQCDDKKPSDRDPSQLRRIAIHRCGRDMRYGINLGGTAVEICAHYTGRNKKYPEVAKATGKEVPYTFMIGGDLGDPQWNGVVWQTLPIYDIGKHARRWSERCVGIGVIGDARIKPPSRKQRDALIDLCVELCLLFDIDPLGVDEDTHLPYLVAHDELPGGSKDPDKLCPGDLLPMNEVRRDVASTIKDAAWHRLLAAGMVL
jgi:hypothetical protein